MAKAYAMIADGTEEVECLAVVDVLRRAAVDVTIVSIGERTVTSSHGVKITADSRFCDIDFRDADLVFIPGGMPGTVNLAGYTPLIELIKNVLARGGRIAAICAAPALVLGANGFLRWKSAVCFPGFEKHMIDAKIQHATRVVTDGNITTARGLGCSIELGLELVSLLVGSKTACEIKQKIQF